MDYSDWNVTPTRFQYSTFPTKFQSRFSIIHDGIDITLTSSIPPKSVQLPDGFLLTPTTQYVTFVNRCVEPYRGCHTLIRSIPLLQKLLPSLHIIIIGQTEGVSYGKNHVSSTWPKHFLSEIDGQYDSSFVHFTGSLDYLPFLTILKSSDCHIYLTYPFVLSWSLLEAMSMNLPVVASSTSPVQEVIQDRVNGLLVDFSHPMTLPLVLRRSSRTNNYQYKFLMLLEIPF